MEKWTEELLDKIKHKISAESDRMGDRIPYWTKNGRYEEDYGETDISWWTNGFWCGILWQMYHETGEEKYRRQAEAVEERLDSAFEAFEGLHHDVGFMWLHSAVADYRLTGSAKSRLRGLKAASILAGRFNLAGGFLKAWNPSCVEEGEDCTGWTIVDSMMNIPLLYWASQETKDPRFAHIARTHADTVLRTLVREDGSCGHIGCMDPQTGAFLGTLGGQGYGEGTSWSRGQAWILYGFALSFRYTGNTAYLEAAKRTAHYFTANAALTDYLPLCDFRQPAVPEKTHPSARLSNPCRLLEIVEHLPEGEAGLYRGHAEKLIRVAGNVCSWDEERDSILQKCMVAYHGGQETDLIYGDYFLLEAALRLSGRGFMIW